MYPTLRPGDLLLVDTHMKPRIGDILVYDNTLGERYVHRFIMVKKGILKTRGDNNKTIDRFDTLPEGVIGVVVGVKNGPRIKQVQKGVLGRAVGLYRHFFKCYRWIYVQPFIRVLHCYPIRLLLQFCGDRGLQGKISLFKRGESAIKLCYKKTTVGTYDLSQKAFDIRPVMKPFFSEKHLQSIQKRVESIP